MKYDDGAKVMCNCNTCQALSENNYVKKYTLVFVGLLNVLMPKRFRALFKIVIN